MKPYGLIALLFLAGMANAYYETNLTQQLQSTYIMGSTGNAEGITMFNDLPIYSNQSMTIHKATFCGWNFGAFNLTDYDANVSRVVNQTWNYSITAAQYATLNQTDVNTSKTFDNISQQAWNCLDVTEQLQSNVREGLSNFSLRIRDPDFIYGGVRLSTRGNYTILVGFQQPVVGGTELSNYTIWRGSSWGITNDTPYIYVNYSYPDGWNRISNITSPQNITYNPTTLDNFTNISISISVQNTSEIDKIWYTINEIDNITIQNNSQINFSSGQTQLKIWYNTTTGGESQPSTQNFYTNDIICGMNLTNTTTWYLLSNRYLAWYNGECIKVVENNTNVDCLGHTITIGANSQAASAITIYEGTENTSIKNCIINTIANNYYGGFLTVRGNNATKAKNIIIDNLTTNGQGMSMYWGSPEGSRINLRNAENITFQNSNITTGYFLCGYSEDWTTCDCSCPSGQSCQCPLCSGSWNYGSSNGTCKDLTIKNTQLNPWDFESKFTGKLTINDSTIGNTVSNISAKKNDITSSPLNITWYNNTINMSMWNTWINQINGYPPYYSVFDIYDATLFQYIKNHILTDNNYDESTHIQNHGNGTVNIYDGTRTSGNATLDYITSDVNSKVNIYSYLKIISNVTNESYTPINGATLNYTNDSICYLGTTNMSGISEQYILQANVTTGWDGMYYPLNCSFVNATCYNTYLGNASATGYYSNWTSLATNITNTYQVINFTLGVLPTPTPTPAPIVNLLNPPNASQYFVQTINLTCNATTTALLQNASVYIDFLGWQINQTVNGISASYANITFNFTDAPIGTWNWNCRYWDEYGGNNYSQDNWTVIVSTPTPTPTPTPSAGAVPFPANVKPSVSPAMWKKLDLEEMNTGKDYTAGFIFLFLLGVSLYMLQRTQPRFLNRRK